MHHSDRSERRAATHAHRGPIVHLVTGRYWAEASSCPFPRDCDVAHRFGGVVDLGIIGCLFLDLDLDAAGGGVAEAKVRAVTAVVRGE